MKCSLCQNNEKKYLLVIIACFYGTSGRNAFSQLLKISLKNNIHWAFACAFSIFITHGKQLGNLPHNKSTSKFNEQCEAK